MSKFYKKLVQPGRPDDPTLTSASGFWTGREHRLAQASGTWPNGIIPIINYLAIGGGGGGGPASGGTAGKGGGGGAGGLIFGSFGPTYKQSGSMVAYTLTITVGAGGAGGAGSSWGSNGTDSTINGQFFTLGTLYAYGGGGGGAGGSIGSGNSGGSGGGGGGWNGGSGQNSYITSASQPTSTYGGYGNRGGYGGYGLGSGGGGGAGGQGQDNRILNTSTGVFGISQYNTNGTGGPGLYVSVAGGSTYSGTFGIGGGAVGTTIGYGSGGGGGTTSAQSGGAGNDGAVIFWWDLNYAAPSIITGTYTYIKENGYRIYKFASSGSITF